MVQKSKKDLIFLPNSLIFANFVADLVKFRLLVHNSFLSDYNYTLILIWKELLCCSSLVLSSVT